MQDIVETHVRSMCMALHSNLPPLQQWAKRQGVAVARHLAARARFDPRPRQRVSQKVNARESVEATMLQCLQGNEAVADDGDILPFFGGPGTPLTSTAPSGKGAERHKADVVTTVAPDGTPDSHASNHDFITFRRGISTAASAGQYVRNNARTHHTFTHCACAFSGAKASHSLDICTFAKCCTMCSLRPAHSTKARSQFTCAARNSSWCEAMD